MGGSHSYGLNTPASDVDLRGVYIVTNLAQIIDPHSYQTSKCDVWNTDPEKDQEDKVYFEVRHFLHLLKKGNTQSVEMLFNKSWTKNTHYFQAIQKKKNFLLAPGNIYHATKGYSFSEYQLAVGTRTGKLGCKRQSQVDKYGFSPKNWCNLLRILYCAETFFKTGEYPVSLIGSYIHPQLLEIKCNPERFTVTRLNEMYFERQGAFQLAWATCETKISQQYLFDDTIAAELMMSCYRDQLYKLGKMSSWYELKRLFLPE